MAYLDGDIRAPLVLALVHCQLLHWLYSASITTATPVHASANTDDNDDTTCSYWLLFIKSDLLFPYQYKHHRAPTVLPTTTTTTATSFDLTFHFPLSCILHSRLGFYYFRQTKVIVVLYRYVVLSSEWVSR